MYKACFSLFFIQEKDFFKGLIKVSILLPALFLKLIGKNRNTKLKAPTTFFGKTIHKITAYIFVYVDHLLPDPVKGSSLLSVFKLR